MNTVFIIQVCCFAPLMSLIAYYTSKMESIRNNRVYKGIFLEVFSLRINNDIAPIFSFQSEKSPELIRLQKIRNIVIAVWWFNFLFLFGFALTDL